MPTDWGAVDVPVYHPHAVVSNFKLECVCRREQQMLGRVNVYVYVRREGPRRGGGKVRSRKSGARTRQLVQVPPAAHSPAPRCGLSCTSLAAFSCILVHVARSLSVSLASTLSLSGMLLIRLQPSRFVTVSYFSLPPPPSLALALSLSLSRSRLISSSLSVLTGLDNILTRYLWICYNLDHYC